MGKYIRIILGATIMLMLIVVTMHFSSGSSGLNCSMVPSGSCSSGTPLLYMKNDSSGYMNAHAQLPSNGTYPYTLCCDANSRGDTLNTACIDSIFLKLYQPTNSHVEMASRSNYNYNACINAVSGLVTCSYYNDSCPASYTCLTSIASSETQDNNQTNAHIGSCSEYNTKVCCRINSPPLAPILISPANNSIITNRTPTFVWNATDPDNDTMTFDLFVTCNGGCSIDNRQYLGLSAMNYTIPTELKFFGDDNYYYNWKVRAYDSSAYGPNSTTFKFTLNSLVILTLINSTVNFSSLQIGEADNTTDNIPVPFGLRNDGNSFADVNLSVQKYLWDSRSFASKYFTYKAGNYTGEPGSFNSTGSTTDWKNIPEVNNSFINLLNYSDATDTAKIDIGIEVPLDEPSGRKSGTLTFTGSYVRAD